MARKLKESRRQKNEEALESGSLSGNSNGGGYYALHGIPFPRFEIQQGRNVVDLILYEITNPDHPHVLGGVAEVGDLEMNLDITVHRSIGEEKLNIICNKNNHIEPRCAACDTMWAHFKDSNRDKESAAWKAFKALNDSRRWIVFLRPRIGPQAGKVTWHDAPYAGKTAGWAEQLENKVKRQKEKGRTVDYTSEGMDGMSIEFFGTKEEKANWFDFDEFDFIDREEPVSEDLTNSMPDLSDFMVVISNPSIEHYLMDGTIPPEFKELKTSSKTDKSTTAVEEVNAEEEPVSSVPTGKTMRTEKPVEPVTTEQPSNSSEQSECEHGREFGLGYTKCPFKDNECNKTAECYQKKRELRRG